ncbi:hypothetical protein [Pelagicoccus mobilis]|uniref:Uncharacterized protein n=1 Tax=Pelagicoccus mobilis TaxID=415221 RepID=A0A934VNH8_9BACT|nr:hypothetical protein [Pelagicoccus mobilis]MBK1876232.1 hypothetical protein [Pelagicoccus mobilis]
MSTHLYLSLIPEALIFSQLPPKQFGRHLSIGSKRLASGPAIFFEIDSHFDTDVFNMEEARKKCVRHPDGTPRRSSYAGVYMVLANVPISNLGTLYLTTSDGLTLAIERSEKEPPNNPGLHLYQEICPVQPRVASPLSPKKFAKYITDPANPVFLPRAAFCDLRINGLAQDPEGSSAGNLPYRNLLHLRECLTVLKHKSDKMTKIVTRDMDTSRLYPVMENGFFVGDQDDFAYYPLPSHESRETKHRRWFNSATKSHRY